MVETIQSTNASIFSGIPWSGAERNHLFLGGFPGHQFEDLSGVTGLDDPGDGRSFALLDYDRDGWLDVALGSPGAPRLRLLRNGIGDKTRGGFIALRFVGCDFKFEAHHSLVPMETFLRCAVTEPLAGPCVELLCDTIAVALRERCLAGALRQVLS